MTKVAELTFNSDFGQSYHNGFAFATKGTDIEVVDQETHEPTAPNLDNQFTTLAASGAQVLLIETSGCVLHPGDGRTSRSRPRGSRW